MVDSSQIPARRSPPRTRRPRKLPLTNVLFIPRHGSCTPHSTNFITRVFPLRFYHPPSFTLSLSLSLSHSFSLSLSFFPFLSLSTFLPPSLYLSPPRSLRVIILSTSRFRSRERRFDTPAYVRGLTSREERSVEKRSFTTSELFHHCSLVRVLSSRSLSLSLSLSHPLSLCISSFILSHHLSYSFSPSRKDRSPRKQRTNFRGARARARARETQQLPRGRERARYNCNTVMLCGVYACTQI